MARAARATRKRIGEILIEEGIIGEEHLIAALQQQQQSGELLGETLVKMGYVSEENIASTVVLQFNMPYISTNRYKFNEEIVNIFPQRLLLQYQFAPIDIIGGVLVVVAGGVLTPDILAELEQQSQYKILVYVGKQTEVHDLIMTKFAEQSFAPQDAATTPEPTAAPEAAPAPEPAAAPEVAPTPEAAQAVDSALDAALSPEGEGETPPEDLPDWLSG